MDDETEFNLDELAGVGEGPSEYDGGGTSGVDDTGLDVVTTPAEDESPDGYDGAGGADEAALEFGLLVGVDEIGAIGVEEMPAADEVDPTVVDSPLG